MGMQLRILTEFERFLSKGNKTTKLNTSEQICEKITNSITKAVFTFRHLTIDVLDSLILRTA